MLHQIILVLSLKMQKQGDYKPSVKYHNGRPYALRNLPLMVSHGFPPACSLPFFSVAFKAWSSIFCLLSFYAIIYDPLIYKQRNCGIHSWDVLSCFLSAVNCFIFKLSQFNNFISKGFPLFSSELFSAMIFFIREFWFICMVELLQIADWVSSSYWYNVPWVCDGVGFLVMDTIWGVYAFSCLCHLIFCRIFKPLWSYICMCHVQLSPG